MPFLWLLFSVICCLIQANGSRIRTQGSSKQLPLSLLPQCEALRSLSDHSRGEATKKALGLLRNTFLNGRVIGQDGEPAKSVPFVVSIGRPLQRPALRELLGCDAGFSDNVEQSKCLSSGITKDKAATKDLKGTSEPSWRQLCAATNIGLERLGSSAVLLTLELPSTVNDQEKDGVSTVEREDTSTRYNQELRSSEGPSAENSVADSRMVTTREGNGSTDNLGYASESMNALTEAAMIEAVAHTLVEAADILVIPLLSNGLDCTSRLNDSLEDHEFGELLCMGNAARGTEGRPHTELGNSQTGYSCGQLPRADIKPVDDRVLLPEDVLQLLQAMRQLVNDDGYHGGTSISTRQPSIQPNAPKRLPCPGATRHRRLPFVVIVLEGRVSQSKQEAIRAEIRTQLGTPEARVTVVGVQPPEGKDARDEMGRLIQGVEPRNASVAHIADALAALLTRQYVSGLPNTSEFAAHALSSNVCAAAFRQSLADARNGLHQLQRRNLQNASTQPFGSVAQRILSEALTFYDYRTRRYQLSLQRRALRKELKGCLEREIRAIFLREALEIESNIRQGLRAELIAVLQKDARHFESLATGVIRKALMTLDQRLRHLLPNVAGSTVQRSMDSQSANHVTHRTATEQPVRGVASDAKAGWNIQQFRNLSHSLLEIYFLLLQKSARDFSAMAAELSGSPLGMLLRQQQGRPWLGISVRPHLSIASLLRLRGNGNLQGYSRYNAGPVQFLFGFTNDGEVLESGRHASFRLQPKLHFDVEVD